MNDTEYHQAVEQLKRDFKIIKEGLNILLKRTEHLGEIQAEIKRQGETIDLLKLIARDHSEDLALLKRQRAA